MHKPLTPILSCLAGLLLMGIASAQDNAATQPSKPAQSTPSAQSKTSSGAAKKPGTTAAKPTTGLALTTQKQKDSYALGMNVGNGMKKQGIDKSVDPSIVARGLRDSLSGAKTAMTEDEMKATIQKLAAQFRAEQEAKAKEAGSASRKEGEAFLAANKSKEGVQTLPDGLQYKVLTAGNGPKPTASDSVTVNYRGTLINGTEFDASSKHGGPATFGVGQVIRGWTEALQLMPVGSKWQLFIPADLAYGDRGAGGDIPPGSTLIFEVELLSIGDQKK